MARIMAQLVIALVLAAALLHGTRANDFTVGDTTGWNRPSDSSFYSTWAANKNFEVDDTLVFNFATGVHDVARVTKDAYDSCNTANPLQLIQTGPATVPLNTTGQHYYICTITGHCSAGQKLSINVVADSDNPSPGPSGTTTPSVPSPPSSATSSRGLTFAFLMSIVIGFFW